MNEDEPYGRCTDPRAVEVTDINPLNKTGNPTRRRSISHAGPVDNFQVLEDNRSQKEYGSEFFKPGHLPTPDNDFT